MRQGKTHGKGFPQCHILGRHVCRWQSRFPLSAKIFSVLVPVLACMVQPGGCDDRASRRLQVAGSFYKGHVLLGDPGALLHWDRRMKKGANSLARVGRAIYKRICLILQHTVWVLNVPHQPMSVSLSLQLTVGCDRNSKQSGQLKVFGHWKYSLKRMSWDIHIFPFSFSFCFALLPHHEVNGLIRSFCHGTLLGYRSRAIGPIDHGPRPPKWSQRKPLVPH